MALTTKRPTKVLREAKKLAGGDDVRISIRVHVETHQKIKMASIGERKTMKAFVLDALRKTGLDLPVELDE